jgi:hypothetical protein
MVAIAEVLETDHGWDLEQVPGVNYVGGSRQLRRRVGVPSPCHGRGMGGAGFGARLAGN